MKFRKESAVFEAIKFEYTKDGVARLRAFARENVGLITKARHPGAIAEAYLVGGTIKVAHASLAFEGDWIVKDENGKFYPCNPDRFYREFEPIPNKKEK